MRDEVTSIQINHSLGGCCSVDCDRPGPKPKATVWIDIGSTSGIFTRCIRCVYEGLTKRKSLATGSYLIKANCKVVRS